MFGYRSEEVIGTLTFGKFHKNESEGTDIIETALREGMYDGEVYLVKRNGSEFLAHTLITKTIDLSENHIGYTILAIDITEHKLAERELIKRNEELKVFNRLAVDRELKMIELKKEVNDLFQKMGKEQRYNIIEDFRTTEVNK
jgi:hypothetical protein